MNLLSSMLKKSSRYLRNNISMKSIDWCNLDYRKILFYLVPALKKNQETKREFSFFFCLYNIVGDWKKNKCKHWWDGFVYLCVRVWEWQWMLNIMDLDGGDRVDIPAMSSETGGEDGKAMVETGVDFIK